MLITFKHIGETKPSSYEKRHISSFIHLVLLFKYESYSPGISSNPDILIVLSEDQWSRLSVQHLQCSICKTCLPNPGPRVTASYSFSHKGLYESEYQMVVVVVVGGVQFNDAGHSQG